MAHKAETEIDPVAKGVLERDAEPVQLSWGCPFKTGRDIPERDSLSPKHQEVLTAVQRLTGAKCSTCPNFYTRLPWVRDGVAARRWRDKGSLRDRVGPYPSLALVRAIDVIDASDAARQHDDYERSKREREAEAERAKRDRENGSRGS
jgi:hypothetical protein